MDPQLMSSQNYPFSTLKLWKITKPTTDVELPVWPRYLSKTCSYTATRFTLEMILLAWFLKLVVTLPISLMILFAYGDSAVWQNPQLSAFAARPVANAILALAVAPILETVIGQWLPLFMVRQWTPRPHLALAASAFFFAGLHFISWNVMIFVATLPVGFVLAWSFFVWQRQSIVHAFGITIAIHALHNAVALCFMIW